MSYNKSQQFRCQVCVMDRSDPQIVFYGEEGCNHCTSMKKTLGKTWFNDNSGLQKLTGLIEKIKHEGRKSEYDCILGLSGGVDSSFLAIKAYEWGLRPLVYHVDAGWNSEAALRNIQSILEYTNWDLETKVIDWNEMRELQLAFLASGIANQDVPQDHAFFSSLYSYASKNKIKFILSGGNTATEGILPKSWQGPAMDSKNLKDIHSKFTNKKLHLYPTTSFYSYYVKYPYINRVTPVRPLNLLPYRKDHALAELETAVGYRKYPRKHGESSFTRFFQEFFLVNRFGIDKRITHLSSQIVSAQISRPEAVSLLETPLYKLNELDRDISFICRKLEISKDTFENYLSLPIKSYSDYKNWDTSYNHLKTLQKLIENGLKVNISRYS
jgi:N-acetyl sugar amidotransferase